MVHSISCWEYMLKTNFCRFYIVPRQESMVAPMRIGSHSFFWCQRAKKKSMKNVVIISVFLCFRPSTPIIRSSSVQNIGHLSSLFRQQLANKHISFLMKYQLLKPEMVFIAVLNTFMLTIKHGTYVETDIRHMKHGTYVEIDIVKNMSMS